MRRVIMVVGGYSGDEAKGKTTHYFVKKELALATEPVLCVRSTGGSNTGATVVIDGHTHKVHQLPVGALEEGCHVLLANGMYVEPEILLKEISLAKGKVYISRAAHVVFPYYRTLDDLKEGKQGYGSTKSGVSIAAGKKYTYKGVPIGWLTPDAPVGSYARVKALLANDQAEYGDEVVSAAWEYNNMRKLVEQLEENDNVVFVDVPELFESMLPHDSTVVVEGTQGAWLDVNHAVYPYVSAGSFTTYGMLDGIGYALKPTETIMCLKAYASMVGTGKFPGEITNIKESIVDSFREYAGEFGTTTKRPRRLGWLDLSVIKRHAQLIQPTAVFISRMDTLDWFPNNGLPWSLFWEGVCRCGCGFPNLSRKNQGLSRIGKEFIAYIANAAGAPVKYLGNGPGDEDVLRV